MREAKEPSRRDAAREPMPEPAALPWGMDKAEVQKSSLAALTDEKLARFVIGQQKKTKYEKEREQRETKKRKADEEAAAMYAKFVASFEDDDATMGKAFVRGGRDAATAGSEVYRLQPTEGSKKKKLGEIDRYIEEMKQQEDRGLEPAQKKRREMDLLVEEIQRREPLASPFEDTAPSVKTGSFDNGDPLTTNLYVGNLAPSVTEEKLERVFGRFGRIYSIKIMWPRTEDERSRRRMSGFVSFFQRREADDARVRLHDSELDGQRIVVGWGKAVKIDGNAAPFAAAGVSLLVPVPSVMAPANDFQSQITVLAPSDDATRRQIDRLAEYVAKDGAAFENAVRVREDGNPQFAFLSNANANDPLVLYYRWRVFAFAMGDSETKWRPAPFQMTMNGPVWLPPPQQQQRQNDTENERSQSRTSRSRSRSPERRRHRRTYSSSRSSSRSRSHSRSRSRSSRRRSRRSRSRSRDRRSSSQSSSGSDRSERRRRRSSHSPHRREEQPNRRHHRYSRSRSQSRSRSPPSSSSRKRLLTRDETMLTGQQLARARDLERGREPNRLPRDEHERFQVLLDSLTLERESIKQAMGCALDNSESAVELVHIVRKQFHREDASAVALVAYLFVASDILHNSSAAVKNASLFRSTFQECLPEIMDCLRRAHRGMQGRMSALAMRDKVLSVLTAWGSWSLFPPHYLVGLNATFMRKVEEQEYQNEHREALDAAEAALSEGDEEKVRKACSNAGILSCGSARALVARLRWLKEFTAPPLPAAAPLTAAKPKKLALEPTEVKAKCGGEVEKKSVASAMSDDVDGEPMDEDQELDGEPLDGYSSDREDLDGEPMDDPVEAEDLDGVPLDEDEGEDLDGEPLDEEEEDLDGEPM